jgi:hypothetical protein
MSRTLSETWERRSYPLLQFEAQFAPATRLTVKSFPVVGAKPEKEQL